MSKVLKVSNGDYKLQVQSGGKILLDAGANGTTSVLSNTASLNTATGALVVTGGVGVGGDIHMGKVLSLTLTTTAPSNPSAGMIAIADRLNWNPLSNVPTVPYPVFYDGLSWAAMGGGGGGGGGGATNLYELGDIHITSLGDGQVLTYSSSAGKWINSNAVGGGTSLGSRITASVTTASIANNITENNSITAYKSYMLLKIQVSAAAWVRLYTDIAARTADASRSITTDPTPGSGVIAEFVTSGAQTIVATPAILGFNNETSPTTSIPVAITNQSGSTTAITVSVTVIQLEA